MNNTQLIDYAREWWASQGVRMEETGEVSYVMVQTWLGYLLEEG
jgi:hypothetical protein